MLFQLRLSHVRRSDLSLESGKMELMLFPLILRLTKWVKLLEGIEVNIFSQLFAAL
jgi:hypothetical protein